MTCSQPWTVVVLVVKKIELHGTMGHGWQANNQPWLFWSDFLNSMGGRAIWPAVVVLFVEFLNCMGGRPYSFISG